MCWNSQLVLNKAQTLRKMGGKFYKKQTGSVQQLSWSPNVEQQESQLLSLSVDAAEVADWRAFFQPKKRQLNHSV